MPIHDWSRVFDGAFHAFHHSWIAEFQRVLNGGILPPDFYAMAEQVARLSDRVEPEPFTRRQKSVVVRHASDDRIIAVIEILSAGNKSSNREFQAFLTKAIDFLGRGIHRLLIDLHPRTKRDPEGIHPEIWAEAGGPEQPMPSDKPLTLAVYDAGPPLTAYVEPGEIGDTLIEMPLFLAPEWYVSVPLEATDQAAFRGVARRYREALESPAAGP